MIDELGEVSTLTLFYALTILVIWGAITFGLIILAGALFVWDHPIWGTLVALSVFVDFALVPLSESYMQSHSNKEQ